MLGGMGVRESRRNGTGRLGQKLATADATHTATALHSTASASHLPNRLRCLRTAFADQRDASRLASLATLRYSSLARKGAADGAAAPARAGWSASSSRHVESHPSRRPSTRSARRRLVNPLM